MEESSVNCIDYIQKIRGNTIFMAVALKINRSCAINVHYKPAGKINFCLGVGGVEKFGLCVLFFDECDQHCGVFAFNSHFKYFFDEQTLNFDARDFLLRSAGTFSSDDFSTKYS